LKKGKPGTGVTASSIAVMPSEGLIQVNTPKDARTIYSKQALLLREGSTVLISQHTNPQHSCRYVQIICWVKEKIRTPWVNASNGAFENCRNL
jgi:hypothetical protein